jgi:hypothetical protein
MRRSRGLGDVYKRQVHLLIVVVVIQEMRIKIQTSPIHQQVHGEHSNQLVYIVVVSIQL